MCKNKKRVRTVQTKWINKGVKLHVHCQSWLINTFTPDWVIVPHSLSRQLSQQSTSTSPNFMCLLKKVLEVLASCLYH
jgi:hypothetical protein